MDFLAQWLQSSSSPSFLFSHPVYQWHLYRFCLWEKCFTVQFVQLVAATEASSWTEQILEMVRRSEMLHNSYVLHTATTNELLLQVLIHHPCKLSKWQTVFIFPSLLKKAHMCCIQLLWPLTLIMPDCQWHTKRTQAVKPVQKKIMILKYCTGGGAKAALQYPRSFRWCDGSHLGVGNITINIEIPKNMTRYKGKKRKQNSNLCTLAEVMRLCNILGLKTQIFFQTY